MPGKIFLNYRRSDAEAWADRLYERLVTQFPRGDIFMDIDGNIPLGQPWAAWLDSQVAACDLMLVLIGRSWVAAFQARSAPGERDYVRVEIESALARKIPVVPVFLGDAPIPFPTDLPEPIRPLLGLQAIRLQRTSFDTDARSLIEGVARSIKLARGEVEVAPATPATTARRTARPAIDQYRAEGRMKVEAKIVQGAPEGWFQPGNGKTEWFKDHDAGPEMVVVPAGSFLMGSPENEPEREGLKKGTESPQHDVTIARPFAVGRHAITRGQFAAFTDSTGYKTDDRAYVWTGSEFKNDPKASWRNPGFAQDDSHPVVCVSWDDAKAYAVWLTQQAGQSYRLLTEAEWEYTARAGTTTPFWWGTAITPAQANYDGTCVYAGGGSYGEYRRQTVPVDSFKANALGLYNVHGNVGEWCEDIWHDTYAGAPTDGSAWLQSEGQSDRVIRGGSWFIDPQKLRSAYRSSSYSGFRSNIRGFRLARMINT
jgi:formylglycine-generating enzyme required for sulfatase activity